MTEADAYLRALRRHLRGLAASDADEIIEELRSHITEKSAGGAEVDSILSSLGSPAELATRYIADLALARAEANRTPFSVLDGVFRWSTLSAAGLFVLTASIGGYVFGAIFALAAILKLFHPSTAGLWTYRDAGGNPAISLRLGFGVPPAGATDILGWWIVPFGLIAAVLLVTWTTRFGAWCARRARAMRRLP